MAANLGDLEVKIKVDTNSVRSELNRISNEDIEIEATITADTSGVEEALGNLTKDENKPTVNMTAKMDETGTTEINNTKADLETVKGGAEAKLDATEGEKFGEIASTAENLANVDKGASAELDATEGDNFSDIAGTVTNLATVNTGASAELDATEGSNFGEISETVTNLATVNTGASAELNATEGDNFSDISETVKNLATVNTGASATISATEGNNFADIENSKNNINGITDVNATISANGDGITSITNTAGEVSKIGAGATATISADKGTNYGEIASTKADLVTVNAGANATISATDNTGTTIKNTTSELSTIRTGANADIGATDNTGSVLSNVNSELNKIDLGADADVGAADNTGSVLSDTTSELETIGEGANAPITASNSTSEGVTAAQSDINAINGEVQITANETSLASTMANIGKKIGKWIGSAIKNTLNLAWDVTKGVYKFTAEVAFDYDDKATTAIINGISTQLVYVLNYMSEQIDISIDTIKTGMRTVKTDLEGYFGKDKVSDWKSSLQYKALASIYGTTTIGTAEEAAQKLGYYNITTGYMEYISKLPKDQWEKTVQQLFGTRGADLMPGIEAMANGTWDEYVKKYSSGMYAYGLDDENLGKLGDLSDAIADFNSALSGLKLIGAETLAPVFTAVVSGITELLESVGAIIVDEELTPEEKGQKIFEQIRTSLSNVWTTVTDWFDNELWPLIQPLLETLGSFLGSSFNYLWSKIQVGLSPVVKAALGLDNLVSQEEIGSYLTGGNKVDRKSIVGPNANSETQQEAAERLLAGLETSLGFGLNKDTALPYIMEMLTNKKLDWTMVLGRLSTTDWTEFADLFGTSEDDEPKSKSKSGSGKDKSSGKKVDDSAFSDDVSTSLSAAAESLSSAVNNLVNAELSVNCDVNTTVDVRVSATEGLGAEVTNYETTTSYNQEGASAITGKGTIKHIKRANGRR